MTEEELRLQAMVLRGGPHAQQMEQARGLQTQAGQAAISPIDLSDLGRIGQEREQLGQRQRMQGLMLAQGPEMFGDLARGTHTTGLEKEGPWEVGGALYSGGRAVESPIEKRGRLVQALGEQAKSARDFGAEESQEAGRVLTRAVSGLQHKKTLRDMEIAEAGEKREAEMADWIEIGGALYNPKTGETKRPTAAPHVPKYEKGEAGDVFIDPETGKMVTIPGGSGGGKGGIGGKPTGEIVRAVAGIDATASGLDELEAELANFNPRNPLDQANPTKRARVAGIAAQVILNLKEAAALGALTGPDVKLLEKALADPTSFMGAYYGSAGIRQQIANVRAEMKRRREGWQGMYPGQFQPRAAPPGGGGAGGGAAAQSTPEQRARTQDNWPIPIGAQGR